MQGEELTVETWVATARLGEAGNGGERWPAGSAEENGVAHAS